MKSLISFLVLLSFFTAHSQGDDVWRPVSKESREYHEYRRKLTEPAYGLAKIKELIAKIEADESDNEPLDKQVYESLAPGEKFTYHMIHAEAYNRRAEAGLPIPDEHKKIFGHLPDMIDEYIWSDRQSGFLARNRYSVMAWMKETIGKTKRIGNNFKHAVIEINAVEVIPYLIKMRRQLTKDHDILTVLLLLMRENEYEPFIRSVSNRKLYGEDSDYRSYLDYNKANEALIIERATEFYNSLKE